MGTRAAGDIGAADSEKTGGTTRRSFIISHSHSQAAIPALLASHVSFLPTRRDAPGIAVALLQPPRLVPLPPPHTVR